MTSAQTEPKEMATLTDTMQIFDKFQTRDEEEKSSDEESFHLPIDDDETEKRDIITNGKEETEDDILDKFETASGPTDLDPTLEASLLDETEEKSADPDTIKSDLKNNESETDLEDSSEKTVDICDKTEDNVEKSDEVLNCVETSENVGICDEPVTNLDSTKEITGKSEETEKTEETETEKTKETETEKNEDKTDEILDNIETSDVEKDSQPEKDLDESKNTEENKETEKTEDQSKDVEEEEDIEMADANNKTENESSETKEPEANTEALKENEESSEPTKTNREPDKCENSNDSSKSNNSESDLLDISIIRDVDEDDANAREEQAKDTETMETADNDEEESCDKASESDVDNEHHETLEKEEVQMEFEDESINNEVEKEPDETEANKVKLEVETLETSKVEDIKEISSISVHHDEGMEKSAVVEESDEKDEEKDSGKENENPEEDAAKEDKAKDSSPAKSGKRPHSETDIDISNKKIKLNKPDEVKTAVEPKEKPAIESPKLLMSFATFMKDKKVSTQLTRSDLEQFCLQKICEAILHKTDIGELHQKIKKYETTIDVLRKDVTQLTKQARDLEIVNKKLMNELKVQNGNKKPLVPLKITRSVGLQVKLNIQPESVRRRQSTGPTVPQKTSTTVTPNRVISRPVQNSNVRQSASPQKTPILSQALQPRRGTPAAQPQQKRVVTPIRAKPSEGPKSASFIDLTDEDDRANKAARIVSKAVPLSQMKTVTVSQNKTISVGNNKTITVNQTKTIPLNQAKSGTNTRTVTTLPQGVRLTSTQLKNGSITLPAGVVTSNAPQLMYVVQPTSTLSQGIVTSTASGTQKAVIVNFQPTNGVLTSSLNGSAVSVIPTKTANSVQLKTINSRKHPAPLPTPPVIRVNTDMPLKPIPPKPHLSIRKTDTGIILQWKMPYSLDHYETIASYQLYAYQETNAPPSTDMWRRVGDVKALALPMACTLTQFADKNKYYFAVRSVDVHKRIGAFSDPEEISL